MIKDWPIAKATKYGRPMKNSSKSQTVGLGQTIWADKLWGIWGISNDLLFISTHFGTVSPLSMFSIISTKN